METGLTDKGMPWQERFNGHQGENAGAQKPTRLEEMKSKHRLMLRLDLMGYTNAELAKELGFTVPTITRIQESPLYKAEFNRMQGEADLAATEKATSLGVKKIFIDEAIASANKLADLRDNAEQGGVQLKSAMEILDRAGYSAKNRESSPLININITERQMQDIDKADEYLRKQG